MKRLDCKWQYVSLLIGVYLGVLIVAAFVPLVLPLLSETATEPIPLHQAVLYAGLGGAFGSAVRALIMLITETGVHIENTPPKPDPEIYLTRWPLYLLKPFVGAGTGLLFYLALSYGVVPALGAKASPNTISVFFFGAVGGIFFEEVKSLLNRLVRGNDGQ
jgi:hypothetical protein